MRTRPAEAGAQPSTTHRRRARVSLLAAIALAAVAASLGVYLSGAADGVESASVDVRFSVRGAAHPSSVVIVAVDDRTLNALHLRWPFPRSVDARAVDVLHADRARTIVYDVQFTQPTIEAEDLALYESIARARNVVLATTEIGPHGETNVLGGTANVDRAHARVAAANFNANASGIIQRYPMAVGGLDSLALTAAEVTGGRRLGAGDFEGGSAWIDFAGPVGTVPTVSFSELLAGRVDPSAIAGKTVVIGATSPVLQDIHTTSVTSSSGMSGPEVQANAILTALGGNRLRDAPGWTAILAILLGGLAMPLLCIRLRSGWALLACVLLGGAYAVAVQLAFDAGVVMVLVCPLLALALGALGSLMIGYLVETWEHRLAELYGERLEQTVRTRTAELRDTQLEVILRLARAAELRDDDTGAHIERVGRVCEQLALQAGLSGEEAERLRLASALHDVGKIGVPDSILQKAGELTSEEWERMKAHTQTGAELLAGSRSPLIQMAEVIARTHHERWDGSGYPAGLRGEEIPLVGRICAICDVFDALCARRPYKDPWPFELVIREIAAKRGTHFDPALVDAFLAIAPGLEGEYERVGLEVRESARAPRAYVG